MLRVNAFLVVLLSLCSVTCEAGLVHRSRQDLQAHALAEKLYKKAFAESFAGQWQEANQDSDRAALLDHGTRRWSYEARDFIHHR